MAKILIWDFDGTLGTRKGRWSGALAMVANNHLTDRYVSPEEIRPFLQGGFPWHTPDTSHSFEAPQDWWQSMLPVFEKAYIGIGCNKHLAKELAIEVRSEYTDSAKWEIFDDALPSLTALKEHGWTHYILSNHVPELPKLIEDLGLSHLFAEVFTSASIGFEKPNPKAFNCVLDKLPKRSTVWMVGDNLIADVKGGLAVGIPSILVRGAANDVKFCCNSIAEVESIVNT